MAIPIDVFLNIALSQYYNKKNLIGKSGDFITSPEISSIFGEVIACFIMDFILQNNFAKTKIVEIGGGNGKLLNDVYNTISSLKLLDKISQFVSIENSDSMRNLQQQLLPKSVVFADDVQKLPTNDPIIIISNELLDAMPIKQFIYQDNKWYELLVENNQKIVKSGLPTQLDFKGKDGDILELPVSGMLFFEQMLSKIKIAGGMCLTIDYGFKEHRFGSTLQAIKNHNKVDFLQDVGNCDITHLVQFSFFDKLAKKVGFSSEVTTQKDFLIQNGILIRSQNQTQHVKQSVSRLTDDSEGGMGNFLVMASTPNNN